MTQTSHDAGYRSVGICRSNQVGVVDRLVAADALAGQARVAEPREVKRLGKDPVVVCVAVDGGAQIEIVASQAGREQAPGPFTAAQEKETPVR